MDLIFRLTKGESERLERAAAASGAASLSEFARLRLLAEAGTQTKVPRIVRASKFVRQRTEALVAVLARAKVCAYYQHYWLKHLPCVMFEPRIIHQPKGQSHEIRKAHPSPGS